MYHTLSSLFRILKIQAFWCYDSSQKTYAGRKSKLPYHMNVHTYENLSTWYHFHMFKRPYDSNDRMIQLSACSGSLAWSSFPIISHKKFLSPKCYLRYISLSCILRKIILGFLFKFSSNLCVIQNTLNIILCNNYDTIMSQLCPEEILVTFVSYWF